MAGHSIVVMGVASSGKSTVGALLSERLNAKFIDGDDLHPRVNVLKMASGSPLTDEDREPWLVRVNDAIFSIESKKETAILVCSALKKKYRNTLREGNNKVAFIFLDGPRELVKERISQRENHYMKPEMVDSQFEALEKPENESDVITISIDQPLVDLVNQCVIELNKKEIINID